MKEVLNYDIFLPAGIGTEYHLIPNSFRFCKNSSTVRFFFAAAYSIVMELSQTSSYSVLNSPG